MLSHVNVIRKNVLRTPKLLIKVNGDFRIAAFLCLITFFPNVWRQCMGKKSIWSECLPQIQYFSTRISDGRFVYKRMTAMFWSNRLHASVD